MINNNKGAPPLNNEIDPKLVGSRIRDIRKRMGLSMSAFAERIDENEEVKKTRSGTVSNWETGKNLPNNARLKIIAELGGVTINELLHGDLTSYIRDLAFSYKRILDNTFFKESLGWDMDSKFNLLVNNLITRVEEKNLSYEDKDAILQDLYSSVSVTFGDFVRYNPERFSDYFERFMGKHIDELYKTMQLYPEEKDQEKYNKWIEIMEKSIQEIKAIDKK